MSASTLVTIDAQDLRAGGTRRAEASARLGAALADIGFFAVTNHGITPADVDVAYDAARRFFTLAPEAKARFEHAGAKGQRGYTSFGKEKARDAAAPDLKEFFQIGRVDVPESHAVHRPYGPNIWPDDAVPGFSVVMQTMWLRLEALGRDLLVACADSLGDDAQWYADAVKDGDTILRVIHYPPVADDAPSESIRAGAHEDINLITLLCGATEDGLELLRRDGSWMPVKARHDEIIVDSGDMLMNVTNGLCRSTTHRVVRPATEKRGVSRFSMPLFVHPRTDVDLTPRAACVARSGADVRYPSLTAGAYLAQRLREIGLG